MSWPATDLALKKKRLVEITGAWLVFTPARLANGFPRLELPFVSLTDAHTIRINLFPSSSSSSSEEKYSAAGMFFQNKSHNQEIKKPKV